MELPIGRPAARGVVDGRSLQPTCLARVGAVERSRGPSSHMATARIMEMEERKVSVRGRIHTIIQ
jgi:hypothetical protein